MSEKRFIRNIVGDIYDSKKDKWFEEDWKGKPLDYEDDLIVFLNEQQATIEEYEDFCLNLCKFLIGKGLVDEYREEYGKEYKIITKWKGCGSDE